MEEHSLFDKFTCLWSSKDLKQVKKQSSDETKPESYIILVKVATIMKNIKMVLFSNKGRKLIEHRTQIMGSPNDDRLSCFPYDCDVFQKRKHLKAVIN